MSLAFILTTVLGTMGVLILIAVIVHAAGGGAPGADGLPPVVPPLQGGTLFDTSTLSVRYPSGWNVSNSSAIMAQLNAPAALGWQSEGTLLVESNNGGGSGVSTVQTDISSLLASRRQSFADAALCRDPTNTTEAGKQGVDFMICYTQTSQNGPTVRIRDEYFISVAADRSAFFEVGWWSPEDDHQQFIQDAAPLVASVTWKL